MIKHPEQRIGVFIDVGNMYHSAKNLYQARVNFGNILDEAVAGRRLVRALAYVVQSQSKEEEAFFEALDKQGFEVRMKSLQIFPGGVKKGDWDVGIAVDTIKLADRLDVVVLVTGDGDYLPLVHYLKENKGCRIEIIAFQETASAKLIEAADEFLNLSANKRKFLMRAGPSRAAKEEDLE
jgi:uncharacterized protein (TIGR00288 family)